MNVPHETLEALRAAYDELTFMQTQMRRAEANLNADMAQAIKDAGGSLQTSQVCFECGALRDRSVGACENPECTAKMGN